MAEGLLRSAAVLLQAPAMDALPAATSARVAGSANRRRRSRKKSKANMEVEKLEENSADQRNPKELTNEEASNDGMGQPTALGGAPVVVQDLRLPRAQRQLRRRSMRQWHSRRPCKGSQLWGIRLRSKAIGMHTLVA